MCFNNLLVYLSHFTIQHKIQLFNIQYTNKIHRAIICRIKRDYHSRLVLKEHYDMY